MEIRGGLMGTYRISLFGRFDVTGDNVVEAPFHTRKVQELFAYLLMRRDRAQPRELLAEVLWNNVPAVQSRKYLRQALWQLQTATGLPEDADCALITANAESIVINTRANMWLDIDAFERTYEETRGISGSDMSLLEAQSLKLAAGLYRGDLLDGWYFDWCIYERERLQGIYLLVLDKLMNYHEKHRQFELCLLYGETILQHDCAHERTHRNRSEERR